MASIQYRGCRLEGQVADAILGVQQTLADHVETVRAKVAIAKPLVDAAALQGALVKQEADVLFAQTSVKNHQGFLKAIGVRSAPLTAADAEVALRDVDVVMINGKIIPLDRGTTLQDIRSLYGAIDEDLSKTKQLLTGKQLGDFIFIVRYAEQTSTVVTDACGSVTQTTMADRLGGIDTSVSSVVPGGTAEADIQKYVIWLGRVGANRSIFLRMRALGLTDGEIQAAYAREDTETLTTVVIDDPTLLSSLISSSATRLNDVDLETLLARTDVLDVKSSFTASDIAGIMRKAIRRGLRAKNEGGFKRYQAAAVLLAQTIDIRRSFSVDAALEGLGSDQLSGAYGSVVDSAVTSAQAAIAEIASLTSGLNQVFEVMAVADNLLDTSPLDVILCLLGLNLSIGISISFDSLINAILAFVALVRGIIDALIAVIAAFGDLVCFIVALISIGTALANAFLECFGIELSVDIPDFLAGLLQAMIDALRAVQAMVQAIADLVISFLSFSISLSITAAAQADKQEASCLANSGILLKLTLSSL